MEFLVCSRRNIEVLRPPEAAHVIISITSTPEDVAQLPMNEHCRGILRLSFADAHDNSAPLVGAALFSRDQAIEIWQFVELHRADIECIVVHCDFGISRSPAVAAALALVLNGNGDEFLLAEEYVPNELVYRLLLETAPAPRADPSR
jgi:predicted protein tyrosine phosphatase